MHYLLLIYANEAAWAMLPEQEAKAMYGEYFALSKDLQEQGKYKGGNRLEPVAKATTVRVRDGKRTVTDGPFAETKEQLGGYYLVEAADLDEAIAIAERIPGSRLGSIEIRPIPAA